VQEPGLHKEHSERTASTAKPSPHSRKPLPPPLSSPQILFNLPPFTTELLALAGAPPQHPQAHTPETKGRGSYHTPADVAAAASEALPIEAGNLVFVLG